MNDDLDFALNGFGGLVKQLEVNKKNKRNP